MDYNWLGVAFVSDTVEPKVASEVSCYMEKLQEDATAQFNNWLDAHGLEQVMGVIVKKGTTPQPTKRQEHFIRYRDYCIYPNKERTRFAVYKGWVVERGITPAVYVAKSRNEAFMYIDRAYDKIFDELLP